jgi:hypothetical protein
MATLLQPGRDPVHAGTGDESGFWIPLNDLERATGWDLKPEGACKGDLCVILPQHRTKEFVRDGAFNIVELARLLGQPAEYHAASQAWAIGESAAARSSALLSLEAPDFALPDLEGRMHSLSDYRGRKVFLVSWASW